MVPLANMMGGVMPGTFFDIRASRLCQPFGGGKGKHRSASNARKSRKARR